LYSLFTGFRGEERADQLVAELQKTEQPDKSLLLCTSLNKLWSEKDRANQWQVVVEKTEPSSTAGQCGRLYLAESFLAAGKLSEAEAHLLALYSSESPLIKARAVVLAGDIALARGKSQEAIKLYWRAAQIQRGTEFEGS
jgi:predicted negative regulator of RcsB-dependent stress response